MIKINIGPQWLIEFFAFVMAFLGLAVGIVLWVFILILTSVVLTEIREWVLKWWRKKR